MFQSVKTAGYVKLGAEMGKSYLKYKYCQYKSMNEKAKPGQAIDLVPPSDSLEQCINLHHCHHIHH
jgi:hypothetical protein